MVVQHPPCTPESACSPYRCHPTLPPCLNPEKCLKESKKKGTKKCMSALSIMEEKARTNDTRDEKKSMQAVNKWLKKKTSEQKKEEKEAEKREKESKRGKAKGGKKCCSEHAKRRKVVLGKEHKEGGGCCIL